MPARLSSIAAAVIAAACFLLAVQGGQWWSIGNIAVGPVSSQSCFGGDCQARDLAWTGGSDLWQRAGVATYTAGLLSALVMLFLAGALAARRSGRLTAAVGLVATGTAAIAGAVFVLTRPELQHGVVSRGLWSFAAAVALGLVATVLTLRRRA